MSEVGFIFPEGAAKQIQEVDKSLSQADNTLLKFSEDMNKLIQVLNSQNVTLSQVTETQKKATENAKQLDAVGKQLIASEEKLKQVEDVRTEAIIKNRLETQKSTREIQLKIKAQQAEKGSIEQLSAVNAILEKRLKSVNLTTEEGTKKANLLRSAIDRNNIKIKENSSALSAQKINIGNYKSALEGLPGPIGNIASKASTLTSTLAKIGPIGALVAGAIAALSAPLIAFFTKSEKGVEMLERKTAGFKAAWSVLVGDMIRGGEKIADTFDKQAKTSTFWQRTLSSISPGLAGLGIRMDIAAESAENYTLKIQELEDQERAMIVPRAEANKQIKAAMLLYNDETKSIDVRLKALQDAIDLENKTADAEIEHQKKVVENIKIINQEKKAAGQLRDDDDKKLQDAIAKEIELSTESMGRQIRATARINAAREEITRKYKDEANKQKLFEKEASDVINKQREEDTKKYTESIDYQIEQDNKRAENEIDVSLKAGEQAINDRKLLIESAIRDRQRQYEAEKLIIESTAKNEKEARLKIFELNKKYIDEDIAAVQQQLLNSELTTEQQIELQNQLKDLQLENQQLIADDDKKKHAEKLQRQKELVDGLTQLGTKIFEFTIANTNAELSALEEKNKKGIISEQEFNKKKAELELKKAKQERNAALFKIAIDTASAVMGSIKASPETFGLPFSAFALAMGLLEAGIVLKEPLPKYWTGKKNTPDTFIAGDKPGGGSLREIVELKTGEMYMAENPTLFKGNRFKGATVYSNPETERMIKTYHTGFGAVSFSDSKLLEKLDSVEKAITSKPVGIFQNGNLIGTQSPTHREIYVNRLKYGR